MVHCSIPLDVRRAVIGGSTKEENREALLSAEEDLSVQRRLGEMLGVCRLRAPSFALLLFLLLPILALVLGQLQQAL